jgi:hypothetical protein
MNSNDFTATFLADRSPEEVYAAINNVRAWWSGSIEGITDQVGGVFIYQYKDLHYSRHRITELIPGKKVVWLVEDSTLSFLQEKSEWTGTTIHFDIVEKDGQTEERYTHEGLIPGCECFTACSKGWTLYIMGSLPRFISTGTGTPVV